MGDGAVCYGALEIVSLLLLLLLLEKHGQWVKKLKQQYMTRWMCDEKLSDNNNNNTWDNVMGAVIMTQVISRVNPFHLMNADQRQTAAEPQTRPTELGCESACRLLYGRHPPSP